MKQYIKSVPQLKLANGNVYDSNARNNSNGTSSFINGERYIYAKAEIDPHCLNKLRLVNMYVEHDIHHVAGSVRGVVKITTQMM